MTNCNTTLKKNQHNTQEYPRKLKRVPLKEELVALTGCFVKALVLQQFIYWSERVSDFDKFVDEEKSRDAEVTIDFRHGWIYKSTAELHDELMFGKTVSPRTLSRRLDELIEAGYLTTRRNPNHKWDRCLQYRPDIVKIQGDLHCLGYALEGYTVLAPFDTVTNGIDTVTNRSDTVTNRSVANGETIPEITIEITTDRKEKDSSAEAEAAAYKKSVSLKSENEIRELKMTLSQWQGWLDDERAERKRKGVIKFIERKIDDWVLAPHSEQAILLFERYNREREAKNRTHVTKFPSLTCKETFEEAVSNLNGTFEVALKKALMKGDLGLEKIVSFIASPKWQEETNGRERTKNYRGKTQANGAGRGANVPATGRDTPWEFPNPTERALTQAREAMAGREDEIPEFIRRSLDASQGGVGGSVDG